MVGADSLQATSFQTADLAGLVDGAVRGASIMSSLDSGLRFVNSVTVELRCFLSLRRRQQKDQLLGDGWVWFGVGWKMPGWVFFLICSSGKIKPKQPANVSLRFLLDLFACTN